MQREERFGKSAAKRAFAAFLGGAIAINGARLAGGALGEGRLDGLWGILGMLCGAMVFAAAYPVLKAGVLGIGSYGKITLPGVTGINHWIIILGLAVIVAPASIFFEKKRL